MTNHWYHISWTVSRYLLIVFTLIVCKIYPTVSVVLCHFTWYLSHIYCLLHPHSVICISVNGSSHSISIGSKFPGRFRVRFHLKPDCGNRSYHTKNPDHLQMGRFYHQKPSISSSQFWLQLSIWVLIVSWHDQYVDCAVLAALSPPPPRIAIGPIFVGSLSKTRQFRVKYRVMSQGLNEYWSDRKSESRRWKSS